MGNVGDGQKTGGIKIILKAPAFYAGTHFLTRLDTKQPLQLKQLYSSFNEYRHLLFLLDDKGRPYEAGRAFARNFRILKKHSKMLKFLGLNEEF